MVRILSNNSLRVDTLCSERQAINGVTSDFFVNGEPVETGRIGYQGYLRDNNYATIGINVGFRAEEPQYAFKVIDEVSIYHGVLSPKKSSENIANRFL